MVAQIIFSERKNIGLRVFPEGNVVVTAPINTGIDVILEKVKSKSKWVLAQQKTFELYRPFSKERLYLPGETHRYLGRQYKLVINKIDSRKTDVSFGKGLLTINTKTDDIEKIMDNFYKKKATIIFKELLNEIVCKFPLFKSFEITLTHRFMKKRWGSCSTNGNIILNTELVKANKLCIEYVILHELCHLIQPNHSKEFYYELDAFLPNWRDLKNKLEISLA